LVVPVKFGVAIEVEGLFDMLRGFSKASPLFNKIQVAKGLRASNDRIPTIKLRGKESFVSKSRPNSKRKTKVTRSDVFFGAEFGGGATPTTKQFLRHRGQSGYFFWPTVRKRKNAIAKEYLDGIERVVKELGIG
jgi:hypothetical protein